MHSDPFSETAEVALAQDPLIVGSIAADFRGFFVYKLAYDYSC